MQGYVRLTYKVKETSIKKQKMSADEDTELRDLVSQTLESNGVLGKLRVRNVIDMTNSFVTNFYVYHWFIANSYTIGVCVVAIARVLYFTYYANKL